MMTRDDIETLIAQVSLGDRAAFAALYDATSAKLFGVVVRILTEGGEAEDVLQEVYVKIWHNPGSYAAYGLSPITWLVTIARNAAVDRYRVQRRRPVAAADDRVDAVADPRPGPEDVAVSASVRRQISACLEELEPDRANAVRGAYLDGLSYEELAARYNVPLNTMRTWLRRSLLKLRDCLTR